jgi:hypothetical protein
VHVIEVRLKSLVSGANFRQPSRSIELALRAAEGLEFNFLLDVQQYNNTVTTKLYVMY